MSALHIAGYYGRGKGARSSRGADENVVGKNVSDGIVVLVTLCETACPQITTNVLVGVFDVARRLR